MISFFTVFPLHINISLNVNRGMEYHPFLFPDDPQKKYRIKEHYIVIDSTDRDRSVWPTTTNFQVQLEPSDTYTGATLSHHYRNVKSIELLSASYPTAGSSSNEACLYLCIPELEGSFDGTNLTATKAFARLIPTTITPYFIQCDLNTKPRLIFDTQGKRLDRMTIQIKKSDGTFFSFGTDTSSPTAPNPLYQVNLVFKVITVEPLIH